MFEVTNPVAREDTMTKRESKREALDVKALLERDEDFMRAAMQALVQAALEAEMTEVIGAAKSLPQRRLGESAPRRDWPTASVITAVR